MSRGATAWPDAWPPGVIGRYLTLAGAALADPTATVDVTAHGLRFNYHCRGCQAVNWHSYEPSIRREAQSHAAECRALPRPGGA
ncbi:hypothetical protein [Streptomyces xiamenensis]|uniref:hypothetical protein n=1 Tax=Streptomyces xiamenensis TaxID=408015 RepID=UPI0035DC014D